jgi:hypothetical protein
MSTVTTRTKLAAASSIAAGVAWFIAGPLQLAGINEHETQVVTTGEHILIGLFSLAMYLTIPAILALGEQAGRVVAARVAGTGVGFVASAAVYSNINGEDAAWFPAVAIPGNLAWLVGSIIVAIGLRKAGASKAVAIGMPLTVVFALPLSAVGGGIIAGAYWIAVGSLLYTGNLFERRAAGAPVLAA